MIDRLQGFFGFTRTPIGRDHAPGMLAGVLCNLWIPVAIDAAGGDGTNWMLREALRRESTGRLPSA